MIGAKNVLVHDMLGNYFLDNAMNERIKELAKEAGLKVNPDGEIGPAFFGSVDAGYRKFAELIVRDCLKQIYGRTIAAPGGYKWTEKDIGYNEGVDAAYKQVKKHFGIE